MFKIVEKKDTFEILGIADESAEQQAYLDRLRKILSGMFTAAFFIGIFSSGAGRWWVWGLPMISGLVVNYVVISIIKNIQHRKDYFKADRGTEKLSWLSNYGKDILQEAYFSDITAVRITQERVSLKDDNEHTKEILMFPLLLVKKDGNDMRVLRSTKREDIIAAAHELAEFLDRPVETK